MINNLNQKGIAPILILVIAISGIGLGAYLIQQQTNLFPRAQYTSADGGECRDNPRLAPPPDDIHMSPADRPLYDYYWKADCSRKCVDFDRSTDCPASDLGADNTRWCYGFKDAGYCLRLQIVKTGTSEDVSNTDRFRESSGKKPATITTNTSSNTTSGTPAAPGSTSACTQEDLKKITTTYYDAKVAQRYARYTAIMRGADEYCVQADLGIEPGIRRDSADGVVKNGRLYLCSRKDNSENALKLVWRVISDNGVHIRELAPEDPNLTLAQVNEIMGSNISAAKTKLFGIQ